MSWKHRPLLLALVSATVVLACSANNASLGKDNPDARVDGPSPGNAETGVECCAISDAPACCMQFGGAKTGEGSCGSVCDGIPNPGYPGWEKRTDSSGCAVWTYAPGAPSLCGQVVLPDAGLDVATDAPSACSAKGGSCTALAPGACTGGSWGDPGDCGGGVGVGCCLPGGSTDGGPDGHVPTVECCPISDAPACCMNYGGTKTSAGACGMVCDGMPWPNDPAWEKRTDANGCPVWHHPGSSSRCGQPPPNDAAVDAAVSCADRGGTCVAIVPGACPSGNLTSAADCGSGVGVACCLPVAGQDGG